MPAQVAKAVKNPHQVAQVIIQKVMQSNQKHLQKISDVMEVRQVKKPSPHPFVATVMH